MEKKDYDWLEVVKLLAEGVDWYGHSALNLWDASKADSFKDYALIPAKLGNALLLKRPRFSRNNWSQMGQLIRDLVAENKVCSSQQCNEVAAMLRSDSIYLEAAAMADDVYSRRESTSIPGGWSRSSDFADLDFKDSNTGLLTALYHRRVQGRDEYVHASAGTISAKDWVNNFTQLYGKSQQYAQSVKLACELSDRIKQQGASLLFVGHSLGGGLATCNAMATNCRAIVFNPASLSADTMKAHGLVLADEGDKVEVFVGDNDVLNLVQDVASRSDMFGHMVRPSSGRRYYLPTSTMSLCSHPMFDLLVKMRELATE